MARRTRKRTAKVKRKSKGKSKRKTQKVKSSSKSCDKFCKKYYVPKMNKLAKKARKHFKAMGMKQEKKPLDLKEEYPKQMKRCKKIYCNPECDDFSGFARNEKEKKKKAEEYKKNFIKDGVHKKVSKAKAQELKNKGAISVCKKPIENVNDACVIS